MTGADFNQLLETRIIDMRQVLSDKSNDYARNDDRLHNFKRAAALKQETPEKALIGFWVKHVTSILDMVDDLDRKVNAPIKKWQEKIDDAINYLILLEALIVERSVIPKEVSEARKAGYDGLICPKCEAYRVVRSGDQWACDGCRAIGYVNPKDERLCVTGTVK